MIGLIIRICANFNSASVFISFYYAYVRSHLEYATVVWNPNYYVHINRILSVDKKFYCFMFKKFGYYNDIKFAPYSFFRYEI